MEDVEQYTTTVRMILCCTPTYLIYPLDSADHRTMQKGEGPNGQPRVGVTVGQMDRRYEGEQILPGLHQKLKQGEGGSNVMQPFSKMNHF